MPMKLDAKKKIVTEVSDVVVKANFAIIAHNLGLSVEKTTELRSKARAAGVYLRVVRNTLARRAVSGTPFECLHEVLIGPVVLVFCTQEAGEAARLIRDFAKENEALAVKALSFGETVLEPKQLEAVANLPSREQALGMLLSVMNAPTTQFVRTLSETYAQFVRVVSAVGDKKRAA